VVSYILIPFPNAFPSAFLLLLGRQFVLLTSHHADIPAFLPGPYCGFLELLGEPHQLDGVVDEARFDVPVQRRVRREGRSVVDLKQRGLEILPDDDVETQQFEAHVSPIVLGLARSVLEFKVRITTDHSLNDEVLDLVPQFGHVHSPLGHDLEHGLQVPLMAYAHIVSILIEHKLVTFLVDRVVCEMHADVLHVLLVWGHIVLGRETGQPVPEDENAQGIHPCHQHVDAQVELQPVDQVGATQVTLHHAFLSGVYVLEFSSQKNTLALGETLRFDDVGTRLSLGLGVEVSFELGVLQREGPCEGEKVIGFGAFLPHAHEILSEHVFAG
jgi:hypothetical protein